MGSAHAVDVVVNGSLTASASTFDRPSNRWVSGSYQASANTAMPRVVIPVTTGSSGGTFTFTVNGSTAFDSFLALYSAFDPAQPRANLIAADDDSGGYPHARLSGVNLAANTTYQLVLTSYSDRVDAVFPRDGDYAVSLSGDLAGDFAITATADPVGWGTVSCSPSSVTLGGSSTCTATPQAGYSFTGFSGDCTGGSCVLSNVVSAKNVVAHFEVASYAISATASPVAGGGVSCSPNPVTHGGNATCTATPNSGYTFTGFSGGCSGASCSLTGVTGTVSVTAHFAAQVNGACGSASNATLVTTAPAANLCSTGDATSVTPGTASYTWGCNGQNGGTSTAANACSAGRGYAVTPSAGANGSISPNTVQVVAHNAQPAFTVTPSGGYTASVGGTCGGSLSSGTYTTNAVTASCTVSASFADITAPTVTGPSISTGPSHVGASLSVTADEAGTGYWVLVPAGSAAPSAAEVQAGVNYGAVTVVAANNLALVANTPATITLSGLSPSTAYELYFVAKDAAGNPSSVANVAITTLAAPVNGTCGSSSNAALVTTAPSANLCSSGTPTSVTTGNSSYTWGCNGQNGGTSTAANACSAGRGYTVTASAGANGSISPNTAQVVAYNAQPAFTVTANSGYTASVGGTCGGSLSGGTYTTSAVTADCAVAASFTLNTYTITLTANPLAGGSVSCSPNPVSHGSSATCTAAPNAGYTFDRWGGDCTGTGACSLSNVTSTKAVTAQFIPVVNGTCGSAANTASAYTPASANLCATNGGTASAVTAGSSAWGWTCSGSSNGGTHATCSAPFETIPGTNGVVGAIQAASTNNWQVSTATSGFIALPAPAPAGVTFSGGATKVVLTGGTLGSQATVVLRFSSIPAGARLYKYGKQAATDTSSQWFVFPATIDRNAGTVTYVLTDGQKGDNDWTLNGTIDDPVGLGAGADVSGVPTLSEWALWLLAGLMGMVAWGRCRPRAA
ncbi:hypothetical protein GCM10028785_11130 [Hydrogenophaga soli]